MNKKYKYILFDWDGTLAKTLDIWLDVSKSLLLEQGIKTTDEQVSKSFGDWKFAQKFGVKDNDAFNKKLIEVANKELQNVKLYDNVKLVLSKIREKGIKTAIVTTGVRSSVLPAIERYNLSNYFDIVLTAEDVVNHKPDPEMLLKAMNTLDSNPDNTLIIGDGPKDILAGKAVKITTVLFYPNANKRFYTSGQVKSYNADFVINDLLELLNIVN